VNHVVSVFCQRVHLVDSGNTQGGKLIKRGDVSKGFAQEGGFSIERPG